MKKKQNGTGTHELGLILLILMTIIIWALIGLNVKAEEKISQSHRTAGIVNHIIPNFKLIQRDLELQEVELAKQKEHEEALIALRQLIDEMEAEQAKVVEEPPKVSNEISHSGSVLTKRGGVNYFNGQKETYYNLPMGGVIRLLHDTCGIYADYWVRDDGCKMYGDYIMLAADTRRIPKGSIVETSLGTGMVCDHCESSEAYDGVWVDIAVTW